MSEQVNVELKEEQKRLVSFKQVDFLSHRYLCGFCSAASYRVDTGTGYKLVFGHGSRLISETSKF